VKILPIDSGMAHAAAALFELPDTRPVLDPRDTDGLLAAASCLLGTYTFSTHAREAEPDRCRKAALWVRDLAQSNGVGRVVLEVPATAGAYARVKKEQRTKGRPDAAINAKLNRAIGAMMVGATLAGAEVVLVPADRQVKQVREAEVNCLLRQVGRPEVTNPHVADAVWLGLVHVGAVLVGRAPEAAR
jgi:hypothetical protein